jgi:hypothetical protein
LLAWLQEPNIDMQLVVPQLPPDVLVQVLAHVPQQQRLPVCSTVSSSMHAAAVAATRDIKVSFRNKGQSDLNALCAWLSKYDSTQPVQHLNVDVVYRAPGPERRGGYLELALPWQCLSQLQSLRLHQVGLRALHIDSPSSWSSCSKPKEHQGKQTSQLKAAAAAAAAAAPASLGMLTSLTSLQLSDCCIMDCQNSIGWVAEQLATITALQNIKLSDICVERPQFEGIVTESTDSDFTAGIAAFAAVLARQTHLTSLSLGSSSWFDDVVHAVQDGAVLDAIYSLSRLQQLELHDAGPSDEPLLLHQLPSSLTALTLINRSISCPDPSSSSSSSSSLQATALQQLVIDSDDFMPATLVCMPQLRLLTCNWYYNADDPWNMDEWSKWLPSLQQLQHFELTKAKHWGGAASSCAALTASSQLTALLLSDCVLPEGAIQHMFGGGRRLPLLQRLDVGYSDEKEADPNYHPRKLLTPEQCGLLLGHGQVQQLVACCPGLAELSLVAPKKGSMDCSEMQQLLQLTALTKLGVGGEWWDDAKVEEVLLQLTGARRIGACCMSHAACMFNTIRSSMLCHNNSPTVGQGACQLGSNSLRVCLLRISTDVWAWLMCCLLQVSRSCQC